MVLEMSQDPLVRIIFPPLPPQSGMMGIFSALNAIKDRWIGQWQRRFS